MIKDIIELNFPQKDGKQYATLSQATITLQDMAEKTITSQIKIDGHITPDFSQDWEVVFKGEKYIMPLRRPQGSIENTSTQSVVDLTFQHWAIYQLKRWYFFTVQSVVTGTVVPNQYIATVSLNLKDFCALCGQVFEYYFGDTITIDLNENWEYDPEPTVVEISNSYNWDVLIKLYDLYGVRWQIEPNGDIDHYVIKVGYPTTEVSHIFEYGFNGGLLRFEQQVQDENIRNMIIGRGGNKNLPNRYFKKHDEDNASFSPDPDWIPELQNVYYSELHGATYRSYIQGWKARHIDEYRQKYPDEDWEVTTPTADKAYAPWAWEKGYNDEKFAPIEFVKDDDSIKRYGELMGGLDNNDEIYPTIQGITIDGLGRIDETVAVTKIESDEIVNESASDANVSSAPKCAGTVNALKYESKAFTIESQGTFGVPTGKHADLDVSVKVLSVDEYGDSLDASQSAEIVEGSQSITVINVITGEEHSASGIPAGKWKYRVSGKVHNLTDKILNIEVGDNTPVLVDATTGTSYKNTWDIWVKNIWGSTKLDSESAIEYAERVWTPILGDREGNEAKIAFSDGMLGLSEDYEFTIVSIPEYDTSKTIEVKDENGNIIETYPSHWKITLGKNDADLEATGVLLPSTTRFAEAGDHFFFLGIDMPHLYVTEAEKRIDDWKKDELEKVKDIRPTIVVKPDNVRVFNRGEENALIDSLNVGNSLRIADKRFIVTEANEVAAYDTVYLKSVTYTYSEPTDTEANILPEVEIVLSNNYEVSANAVAQLSGEVSALHKQIGSLSNVAQVVRSVGDTRYIRKDMDDRASGRIEFMRGFDSDTQSTLKDGAQFGTSFAEGATGFGGKIDKYGDAWLGSLRLREFLEVPEYRYNRTDISIGNAWNAPGGGVIERVTPDYNDNGTIANTGIITLHLEYGEIGAVEVGDLCQGIFHDAINTNNNATADSDDGYGNFQFAGFCSVYFKITQLLDSVRRSEFRYELREKSGRWKLQNHPTAQMHFVGYGNIYRTSRQSSRYSTRTYQRYLKGVDDWEFESNNIAAQFGDLSNLSLYGIDMSGYSAYLNNIYMTGRIEQLALSLRMELDYGNDTFISKGDTRTINCKVYRGWEDVTTQVTEWSVTRDTGNTTDDETWSQSDKAQNFKGTLTLDYSDLGTGATDNGAIFIFTAIVNDEMAVGSATLRLTPLGYTENLCLGSEFPATTVWAYGAHRVNVTIDNTHTYQGRNSIKNAQSGLTANEYNGVQQTFMGLSEGEEYTASIWLYCEDLTTIDSNCNLELQVFDANGTRLATGHWQGLSVENEWQQFVCHVTIPAGASYMYFHAYLKKNGIIWYSSPKLERGVNNNPIWSPNPADRIAEIIDEYYVSTSPTLLVGGSWTTLVPVPTLGKFIWTRQKRQYGDGTVEYTGAMCMTGEKGEQGEQGEKGDKGEQGAQGEQGIQGCLYRLTQWVAEREYRNDSALETDELRYVDIVIIPNSALATKGTAYRCKVTHTSNADNIPGTTGGTAYWEELNSMAPIYTPLLLADDAVITLLQSNSIVVMKEDGTTVNAALGAGEYPLWVGAKDPRDANFSVDDTGRATMKEANISGKVTAGDPDGQRVELQPDDKAMKIYDENGVEASSFEGNSYSEISDIYEGASGNFSMLFGSGERGLSAVGSFDEEVEISSHVHTTTPTQFVINGYLYSQYTVASSGGYDATTNSSSSDFINPDDSGLIGPVIRPTASAKVTLYLDTYSDASHTERLGRQTIATCAQQEGGIDILQKKVTTTQGGYHVLVIAPFLTVTDSTYGAASIKWGSAVSGKSDISGSYSSDFYMSKYFANGFCLGINATNYIMAYNRGGSYGMRFIMENNGYGIDISSSGVKHRHHGGNWVSMPMLIMKAHCRYMSSTTTYTFDSIKTFNGYSPTLSRVSQGDIRITYPATWTSALPTLSTSNLMVNVEGYGTEAESNKSPVKAQIKAITSTYIEITLSDDETLNDGAFLIDVSLLV